MRIQTFIILFFPFFVSAAPLASLHYTPDFIFKKVLSAMRINFDEKKPIPPIFFESQTELPFFQDSIENQWGFRPDVFSNAYSILFNRIFLIDDVSYYQKLKRCMDDSLAHELVHFVQVKYQGYDLSDESLEYEAIAIQTDFRANHCKF